MKAKRTQQPLDQCGLSAAGQNRDNGAWQGRPGLSTAPTETDVIQYILRRMLILPVIILLVTLILFFLIMRLPLEQRVQVHMPSVRPTAMLDPDERARLVANVVEEYRLGRPFPVQYANWLRNLLSGQWGYSPTWQQPVLEGLLQRAPGTAELVLLAMVPSVALAVGLGSVAARHYSRLPDHLVRAATFAGWAFPSFILGMILMNVL